VINVRTQTEEIDATPGQERLFAELTGSFGLLALALASVGVYGVMAYMVARRSSPLTSSDQLQSSRVVYSV